MKTFVRFFVLATLFWLCTTVREWPAKSHPATPALLLGTVTRVIDGDTALVKIKSVSGNLPKDIGSLKTEEIVRYIGINTPELSPTAECFAARAKERNELLSLEKEVTLQLDIEGRDRFGRLLAYVYIGKIEKEELLQDRLINGGFGHVLAVGLNISKVKRFLDLQRQAIQKPDGLWNECSIPYKKESLLITIADIQYIGDDEILTLHNKSDNPIDLTGWKLVSLPSQLFTLPRPCTIQPYARLRIHSGPKADRRNTDCSKGDLFWTNSAIWNNDGDNALLQMPGTIVVDYADYKGGHPLTHSGH
jgi:endonuclease YncB( thermonuclease family)